jgi:hypothetical protein
MNSPTVKKEFKGNIGLFSVCVEISKMNLIVLPTSRNTKGLDLVVLHPDTNKSIGLQVKCSDKNESPVFSSFWYNYKEMMKSKIISPFIFVDISEIEKPKYFILSQKQITTLLQKKIKDYIDDYTKRNNATFDEICNKEKDKRKNADNWTIKYSELSAYLDNWVTITDLIK